MWYSKCKEEIPYTGFEIVGGDSRCNRTPPILNSMKRFVFHHFFLSIFSLNNRANSSPNAATPLSVNTE